MISHTQRCHQVSDDDVPIIQKVKKDNTVCDDMEDYLLVLGDDRDGRIRLCVLCLTRT